MEETFEDAFVRLFTLATRTAGRILRDEAGAEDVAAETLARAYAQWPKVEEHADAWVTRVAINLSLDSIRRSRVSTEPGIESHDRDPLDALIVEAALTRLPRRQRDALVLRFVMDLDEDAAARLLGVSKHTLHTHVKRGLSRLRATELTDLCT